MKYEIAEHSVHRHFRVDSKDGAIRYVTWNWLQFSPDQAPAVRWSCTCHTTGCEHIAAVQTCLTRVRRKEKAA